MMNRFPSSAVGAGFVVRVAEVDLELDKNFDASRLARRALAIGARGDIRAEALWIAGASEFRRHQYSTARQALVTLIAENPNDRYTEGARRQLAMLEEDTGNREGALDQYIALDYRHDVAYFVDVLMTPEQLAAFIEKRPSLVHRDELSYALAIRYLRDRRWNDARGTMAKIRTIGRNADDDFLLWRRAREARTLMTEALANCKPQPAEERLNPNSLIEVTPSTSVLKRYLNQDLRAAWLASVYDLEYKMSQVLRDRRGISAAAFYVASHGLFFVLLLRLLLNW